MTRTLIGPTVPDLLVRAADRLRAENPGGPMTEGGRLSTLLVTVADVPGERERQRLNREALAHAPQVRAGVTRGEYAVLLTQAAREAAR
ncbi:hypothetical protein ACFW9F_27825 [Streptomyces sp. NPDC059506]|uniref:hypothetical protein n=1 Tax=Streptomyces sp. NPDC059506 TaxID=3347751 RepID=UPI003677959F